MTLNEFAEMVQGKVWIKGDKIRIYFQSDKTAKAYLDYDEDLGDQFETGIEGANLRVYSDCQSQSRLWNVNRAKQIKFELMQRIAAITGDEICDKWEDVIL